MRSTPRHIGPAFGNFSSYICSNTGTQGGSSGGQSGLPIGGIEPSTKGRRTRTRSSFRKARTCLCVSCREEKRDITPELFVYCLNDFWRKHHDAEATLTFRDVAHGHGSPGQIFKLPEDDIRERLEALGRQTERRFVYSESTNIPHIQRSSRDFSCVELLRQAYPVEIQSGR